MSMNLAEASVALDIGTLFVIAICVTSLLGLFLLFAWIQERIQALAWWGVAYLIGGFSGAIWRFGDVIAPSLPSGIASILLFIAVGMIWTAARLFHGRPVLWGAMCLGAAVWLIACMFPAFADSAASHILLSSLIVAFYTFLTAIELWRERRNSLIRRWPAIFVPMLHGAIFFFPVALATLAHDANGVRGPATGWIAVFAIEIVLYVVGAAFIVLILAKDRTVRFYKMAAATDPLTGLLNRRGFFEAAGIVMGRSRSRKAPVSVLAFDLDHFKSINDRFGHGIGDATLQLFATVVRKTMRADDIIGRLGGEEFVAMLPGILSDAGAAAERVRSAFAAAGAEFDGRQIAATVSIGVACGSPFAPIEMLIARADAALYRAKMNGRDRVETVDAAVGGAPISRHKKEGAEADGARKFASRLQCREDTPPTLTPNNTFRTRLDAGCARSG
ncbi:MAG: GGDEF domain-containing protein [Xanthobacteraceae bacterium]|jgi:diguanylate cyclase (GGDEF)-like protein